MSAEPAVRAVYLDSSAIAKLAVAEAESAALRAYLRRRRPLVSSALARTEVLRALAPLGAAAVRRGAAVLTRLELRRVFDRVLSGVSTAAPADVASPPRQRQIITSRHDTPKAGGEK